MTSCPGLSRASTFLLAARKAWMAGSSPAMTDDAVTRATHSDLRLQPRHRDAVAGELIGALVFVVAGVALDPVPVHLMRLQRGVEALPEIDILDRLLVRRAPAVLLPAVNPPGDAL